MPVHEKVRLLSADGAPEGQHIVGRSLSETVQAIYAKSIRDPVTGCLLWQGHLNHKGYGRVSYNGRYPTVHRVMHSCDTPNCGEPTHLSAGTGFTNMQERAQRRDVHKLIPEEVFRIRDMICMGGKDAAIAKWFNIGQALINRIRNGKRWSHIVSEGG